MTHLFAIQCDKLHDKGPNGPLIWQTLMWHARAVGAEELLEQCDTNRLFDDGESYEDFTANDPSSRCFVSDAGGHLTYFIQTCGFEFFFTKGGAIPEYFETGRTLVNEISHDPLARLLLPANSALSNGMFGDEIEGEWIDADLEFIDGINPRFRLIVEGDARAGISISKGTVESLYVARDSRRSGLATEIFQRARAVLGDLEHSHVLTPEGTLFVKSFDSDNDQMEPSL
jgi:hypothetical protein